MSLRTCKFCNNEYPDSWSNWYGKFCCKECYRKADPVYKLGDKVYTYKNSKDGKSGLMTAYLDEGEITCIYKLNRATPNGIYQYAIKSSTTGKVCYRFYKDVFDNQYECLKNVDVINKRREIMRQANGLLKEI